MKTNLTLIFILFSSALSAQEYKYVPFPDSNAVWSEVYWDSNSPSVFNQYALFKEDTLMNGLVYHKLYHNTNSSKITSENSRSIGGIREDNHKRVWANNLKTSYINPNNLNENGEIMLYDFSLKVGDTISARKNHANFGHGEYMVVKHIDSLQIHQSIRKVFSFEPYPWVKWIEGIGNVQGLLFPYGDLTTGGFNNRLVCMHHNDTLMYFNYYDSGCVPQFVIDGIVILPNPDIKVYPNPVTNGIVYFEDIEFETLELFDLNGNLVRFEIIKGMDCFTMDVLSLPPGNYYYRLKTKGLIPTQGKLIIQ
jgi:hypothetical protein